MPKHNQVAPEVQAKIEKLAASGLSGSAIARELGVDRGTVAKYRKGSKYPRKHPEQVVTETSEVAGDGWTISLPKTRIHTEEQLIEHFKIDLEKWYIERMICNAWEMGYKDKEGDAKTEPLYQVKAYLVRNKVVDFARRQVDQLREEAKKYSPKFPAIIKGRSYSATGNLAEFSIVDAHFGAHIWGSETGGDDYDLKIAERDYLDAAGSLVKRVKGYGIETALYVIGNDQVNADNRAGSTEKQTPQQMDGRYEKVFSVSKRATIQTVDMLLSEFGRVHILPVPGNHDFLSTFRLADVLSAWYRRCKQVTIDLEPRGRKFYQHGIVGLMFEHGNNGKIENYDKTFAAENPQLWGATKWREIHTADKHHRRTIELVGATVRILPSLRPQCAWTSEMHYVGSVRAAESYVWNNEEGMAGMSVYSILNAKAKP